MQQNKPFRVVIDTNIWISFLIGKALSGLTRTIIRDEVVLLFSDELFEEFLTVVQRPKFERYFSTDAVRELIALLQVKVTWIEITDNHDDCRDAKDNFLLDLSVSGQADYLVTGDGDLLDLNPFHDTQIITYREFGTLLGKLPQK
jgi:putative PIN family toxin of toxin-antitoxin system